MSGGHGHDHGHHGHSHHGHAHAHGPPSYDRAFAIGVVLNLGFVAIEAGYGIVAGSLALVADAGHNLSDVAGLLLAWGAAWLSRQAPTSRRTYGFGRASILAALANGVLLLVAIGAIAWEALRRLFDPQPVEGGTVIAVAAAGIVVNTATALLFLRGRKEDLNIRGAFLHMVADAAVSAGVLAAGAGFLLTGWLWLDPVTSLVIAVVIGAGTWGLLKDSLSMAVDSVPASIHLNEVEALLSSLPGVERVHDLHVWPLSTTTTALTAHLVRPGGPADDAFHAEAARALRARFGIDHVTLQLETGELPCELEMHGSWQGGAGT